MNNGGKPMGNAINYTNIDIETALEQFLKNSGP